MKIIMKTIDIHSLCHFIVLFVWKFNLIYKYEKCQHKTFAKNDISYDTLICIP